MASDTAILRFLCNMCCTIVKKGNVNQHLKVHHGNMGSKCERCGFTESDPSRMEVHLQVHLQERFECPQCGDIYSTAEAYLVHYFRHKKSLFQQKIFYECSKCGQSFYPTVDIQQRLQRHEAQHAQPEAPQTQTWDPSSLISANVKEEMYDEAEKVDEKPCVSDVIQGLEEEYGNSTDSYVSNGDLDALGSCEPEVTSVFIGDVKVFENIEPDKDTGKNDDQSEVVNEGCAPKINGAKKGAAQTVCTKNNVESRRPKRQCAKNVQYEVLSGQADAVNEDDVSDLEQRLDSDAVIQSPTPTKVSETGVRSYRPKRQSSGSVENEVLSCEVCKKTFKSKLGFEYHKNTQHLEERKLLPCEFCEKTFMTKQGLEIHKKNQHFDILDGLPPVENNEKEQDNDPDGDKLCLQSQRQKKQSSRILEVLSCEVCKKTFKSKNGFEYHKNTQHLDNRELLPCEFCEKTFRTNQGLQNHQKNHHSEKVEYLSTEGDNDTEQDNDTEEDEDEDSDKEQDSNTKSLSCKMCEKVFETKRMLRYHQKTDHGQSNGNKNSDTKVISCNICQKILKSKRTLYYHKKTHCKERNTKKRDAKKISCDICNKSFKTSWFLKYHKKTHHSDKNSDTKVISCDICEEVFENSLSLKVHMKEVHQKEIHEESLTSDEEEYVPRKRTWRGEGGECVICKKFFKDKNSLRSHQRTKHEKPDVLLCRFCKKGFKTKNSCDIHERTQHIEENIASGVVPCEICQKLFTSMERLRDHQKTYHLEEGMELCSVCGESFKTKSQYRYHMKQHKANFECKACHKTFHTKKKLKRHMNLAGCHMCEVCGLKFKQHYNLVTHRTVHTGEKPFQCYECGKCFRVKYYLEEHLNVHKGIRNYPCLQCDWKFKTMGQLRRHTRSHTGFRPFMCSQCGKAFAFPANLKRHERIHTGETYSCPLCDRKITEKSNLQKHLRIHEKRGEKILGPVTTTDSFPWESDGGKKEEGEAEEQPGTDLWQLQMEVSTANATRENPVVGINQDAGQLQMDVSSANATEENTLLDTDQNTSALLGLI